MRGEINEIKRKYLYNGKYLGKFKNMKNKKYLYIIKCRKLLKL